MSQRGAKHVTQGGKACHTRGKSMSQDLNMSEREVMSKRRVGHVTKEGEACHGGSQHVTQGVGSPRGLKHVAEREESASPKVV